FIQLFVIIKLYRALAYFNKTILEIKISFVERVLIKLNIPGNQEFKKLLCEKLSCRFYQSINYIVPACSFKFFGSHPLQIVHNKFFYIYAVDFFNYVVFYSYK